MTTLTFPTTQAPAIPLDAFELMSGQRIVPQPSITMRPQYGLKARVKTQAYYAHP